MKTECVVRVHSQQRAFTNGGSVQEIGVDISGNGTQAVWDVIHSGQLFAHVITVCDEASIESEFCAVHCA